MATKKVLLASLVLAMAVLVLAAGCAAPPPRAEFTIGIGALPKTLDPNSDSSLLASPVYRLIYDNLVYIDEAGKPQPALAESWQTVTPTVWQFKLRKGVKFHNGEEFNAEAARFTLDRARDPKTKSVWAARFAMVDKVEVVDEYTLNIHTKKPSATLLPNLVIAFMIPLKYFQEKGEAGFVQAPVGTGYYKVKEWRPDDFVVLEANKDYWRGAPKTAQIRFRMMPEDATRVAALEAGEIDLAYAIPPEHASRLKGKGFNVMTNNIGHAMTITLRATVGGPLADKRVRQALNFAVDKEPIIKQILAGYGRVLDGQLVGPDAFGYNPNLKPYPYDPGKAKQLLAQAGYADGFSGVKFHCSVGRYLKDKEVCEAVASQLAQVGVKTDMEILESGVWWELFSTGKIAPMYDIAWLYAPAMDLEFATVHFTTASPRKVLASKEYDALYGKQATTTDPSERLKALYEVSALLREEAPAIFLYQVPGIYGVHKRVENLAFRSDYSFDPIKVTVK